ncbi:MAG: hypothetical protein Q4C08_01850 [Pseudomonadota bacterium]|nr:hypothetical protein [Pseudomonadota bacterium]
MSFLKNAISLMAIFSVIPAAYAVTARPGGQANRASVVASAATGAARRMPTMSSYITGTAAGSVIDGGMTSTTLLANKECIDAYTDCIKGGDACGTNFEECTNDILFHAKMPQCISTLMQCSSAGVNSLFGTSTISALNNVTTKNAYGEITKYAYPTDGSVLGQMITAAAIENMYDTQSCVRRYTSCLKKESVCGEDFELCTTNSEFKKQAVFCDSTLARCQSEGKTELFGNAGATSSTAPSASSRIGALISEGAGLAAVNAVSTCYKVADQCILNACNANPYKCYENATQETINVVDAINNGTEITQEVDAAAATVSKSAISSYVRNSCMDTIGSNKYCYATFLGDGQMPTSSQLRDEDNQAEIYDMAYSARMNSTMKTKIVDLVNKFDTKAKEKCIDTIKSCAMRVCGSGSGAACYSQVFGAADKSINNDYTRNEIRTGCLAVVNTDPNCKYAAQNPNATGTYNYSFMDATAFDVLFPEYDDGAELDPIGVVASLNSALATNYSDAALAKMKKQCQSVATSCVKSMCGNDYVNCYRNRTDIYSSLTNSGSDSFDKSMNKVGGVLDYTIVLGLCVDTVKNADICTEHLAIESNKLKINKNKTSSWGDTGSVRSEWIDAGSASAITEETETVEAVDENGNKLCSNSKGDQGVCYTVDATGDVYDTPVTISYTNYIESQAASTLFKDLIYDLEIEAQAKYNAKLTKQQNLCMSSNNGGIIGNKDMGSTFMWAKLKSNKVPTNYAVAGLKTNQFVASNDLYGSFCRVRVTLQSDDRRVNDALLNGANWSTAYFAAGDTFTCGSWIPTAELEKLAQAAGDEARAERKEKYGDMKDWATVVGVLGGGVGGGFLGKGIQEGSVFSGLTGKKSKKKDEKSREDYVKSCKNFADQAIAQLATNTTAAQSYMTAAVSAANKLDVDSQYVIAVQNAFSTTSTECTSPVSAQTKKYFHNNVENLVNACGGLDTCRAAQCKDAVVACSSKNSVASENSCLKSVANSYSISGYTATASDNPGDNNTITIAQHSKCIPCTGSNATKPIDRSAATSALTVLKTQCEIKEDDDEEDEDDDKSWWEKSGGATVGAAVGAIAGGVLANKVVGSIQDQELNNVERKAFEEFMDTVGSKIRCFVGPDEVGMYGEMISTSME